MPAYIFERGLRMSSANIFRAVANIHKVWSSNPPPLPQIIKNTNPWSDDEFAALVEADSRELLDRNIQPKAMRYAPVLANRFSSAKTVNAIAVAHREGLEEIEGIALNEAIRMAKEAVQDIVKYPACRAEPREKAPERPVFISHRKTGLRAAFTSGILITTIAASVGMGLFIGGWSSANYWYHYSERADELIHDMGTKRVFEAAGHILASPETVTDRPIEDRLAVFRAIGRKMFPEHSPEFLFQELLASEESLSDRSN